MGRLLGLNLVLGLVGSLLTLWEALRLGLGWAVIF